MHSLVEMEVNVVVTEEAMKVEAMVDVRVREE